MPRATARAEASTDWLIVRVEAVAMAMPSTVVCGEAPEARAFGRPTRIGCRADRPTYCSTKAKRGSEPSPSRKTGSRWESTFTSRNVPSGARATRRSGGVPPNPGIGAKSMDSKA
ncbi:hypothetical protein ACFQFG_15305 [Methylobacterium persicinum]